jgi:hypothetical protein
MNLKMDGGHSRSPVGCHFNNSQQPSDFLHNLYEKIVPLTRLFRLQSDEKMSHVDELRTEGNT